MAFVTQDKIRITTMAKPHPIKPDAVMSTGPILTAKDCTLNHLPFYLTVAWRVARISVSHSQTLNIRAASRRNAHRKYCMSYEQAPACDLCETGPIFAHFQRMSPRRNIRALPGISHLALQHSLQRALEMGQGDSAGKAEPA